MSKEKLQTVYKQIDLISPQQANRLGIGASDPIFVDRMQGALGYTSRPFVHNIGSVIESHFSAQGEKEKIVAYPNLRTVIALGTVGYYGAVPFTGFMAVGELIGEFTTECMLPFSDLRVRAERMRVIGIKVFLEDKEMKRGYVEESIDLPSGLSVMRIVDKVNTYTRSRYGFEVISSGEVLFEESKGGDKHGET